MKPAASYTSTPVYRLESQTGVSYFQRVIDRLIEKYFLKRVYAFVDNITVSGYDKAEHDLKLKALLAASEAENLTFNTDKCVFEKNQKDLLGIVCLT